MKSSRARTFSSVLLAWLAMSPAPVIAQEEMPPQPHLTRETIDRAVSAAARQLAQPAHVTRPDAPNRSWAALAARVKPGAKLAITLINLTNLEGELSAIDVQAITIRTARGPQTIDADEVFRVRRAGVRKRHVLRGMLIGVVVGAVVLPIIDQQSSHPTPIEAAEMGAIVIGLPLGAIAGALVPTGPPLYEAPRPVE